MFDRIRQQFHVQQTGAFGKLSFSEYPWALVDRRHAGEGARPARMHAGFAAASADEGTRAQGFDRFVAYAPNGETRTFTATARSRGLPGVGGTSSVR